MSWLSIGLGYVFLYVVAIAALEPYPAARAWIGSLAQLGAAAGVIAVVVSRRKEWQGCQRLFWLSIAFGTATWIAGHLGWAYVTFVEGRTQWVAWHTILSFCGGAAPLLALLARPHLGARQGAYAVTAIDIAIVTVVTAFLATYFILVPNIDPSAADVGWTSLLRLAQAQRLALVGGMVAVALSARRTSWAPTYWRLAGGLAIGSVLRAALNIALAEGRYLPGSVYDLAWLVPYLAYAWAAAEAPASEPADPRAVESPASPPWLISAGVATIPVVGFGVQMRWPLGQAVDAARVLVTTLTILVGLALVTIRMIAQRRELRRADQRVRLLAAVTEQTKELVLIVRSDGRLEEANDAFLAATGYTRNELLRGRLSELLAPGAMHMGKEIRRAVSTNGVWRGTLLRRRKDGTTFPASCTVTALRNEGGEVTHFIGVERDVSDEMNLREQLIHAERLAAMSEVVAGVAHEINNPLQAILGCTELLLDSTSGQTRNDLEIVRGEAIRAGQIVRNLLAFVHRGTGERRPVDLNEIVQSTAALRAYHLNQSGIALDLLCHGAPLPVIVNQEEIRQALLNLLLNAEHAVRSTGRAGRITIATWPTDRGPGVEVADDGPGVPAGHRGRIFEPFFTTKEVGEGTGLGLSISLGIALAHGGTLEFHPSPMGGAAFRLTLPPYREGLLPPAVSAQGIPARTALIVEDDIAIQNLLTRLLEKRGYTVALARNGAEALDHVTRALPDLVVSDARMPRMSGQDFYRLGGEAQPSLFRRFVMMTGDTGSEDVVAFAQSAGVPLLRKPFTAAELDAALARVQAPAPRE